MSKGTIRLTPGAEVVTPKGPGIVEDFEQVRTGQRGRPVNMVQVSGLLNTKGKAYAKPQLFRINELKF